MKTGRTFNPEMFPGLVAEFRDQHQCSCAGSANDLRRDDRNQLFLIWRFFCGSRKTHAAEWCNDGY